MDVEEQTMETTEAPESDPSFAVDIPSQGGNGKTGTQIEVGKELSDRAEQRRTMAEAAATQQTAAMIDQARAMANAASQGHFPDVSTYSDGRISDYMPDSFESAEEASKFIEDTAETLDEIKTEQAKERAQQQPQEQQQQQAQPDAWDVPGEDGLTPRTRQQFSENPQLAQTVEAMSGNVQQAVHSYAQAQAQAVQAAEMTLLADYPEIMAVPAEHRQSALNVLAQNNPERFQQFAARYQQLEQANQQYGAIAQAYNEATRQQYHQQFQQWAAVNDAEYDKLTAKMPAAEKSAIANEAKQIMLDTGLSEQDVDALWSTHPLVRSIGFQRILMDAARYRLASRGIEADREAVRTKQRRSPPPVQRPGTNMPLSRTTPRMAELESKGSLSVREAAELVALQARRRAS